LVKAAVVYNNSAGTQNVSLYAQASGTPIFAPLVIQAAAVQVPIFWNGLVVLQAGDTVNFNGGAAGVHVWLSGSKLQG